METPLQKYAEIQAMVQKDARDIAEKVYAEKGTSYGVAKVPLHYHNGIDSPTLIQPAVSYIGFVPYMEDPLLQYALPGGWEIIYQGLGDYRIIHNLGKASNVNFYSFVANAAQSTNAVATPVVSIFENEVEVIWFTPDGSGGFDRVDTSFVFTLTTGNNKSPYRTQYETRNFF